MSSPPLTIFQLLQVNLQDTPCVVIKRLKLNPDQPWRSRPFTLIKWGGVTVLQIPIDVFSIDVTLSRITADHLPEALDLTYFFFFFFSLL